MVQGCNRCKKAIVFLKKRGVKFISIDISKNTKARKRCETNGCHTLPVFQIDKNWICGFDKEKLEICLKG